MFKKILSKFGPATHTELPWERAKREYEALSDYEKTWQKLSTPARQVYTLDVGTLPPARVREIVDFLEKQRNDSR